MRRDRLDALAIGLLLTCCLFWGLQQVLIKLTLAEMPPVFQAWLRLGGATVLLLLWCRWRGVSVLQRDGTRGGIACFATDWHAAYRQSVLDFVSETGMIGVETDGQYENA